MALRDEGSGLRTAQCCQGTFYLARQLPKRCISFIRDIEPTVCVHVVRTYHHECMIAVWLTVKLHTWYGTREGEGNELVFALELHITDLKFIFVYYHCYYYRHWNGIFVV